MVGPCCCWHCITMAREQGEPDGPCPAKHEEVDVCPRKTPGAEPPYPQSLVCCWSMAAGKPETRGLLWQSSQIIRARVSFWAESGHVK